MYENYIYSKTHLIFEMQMKENLGSTDQSLISNHLLMLIFKTNSILQDYEYDFLISKQVLLYAPCNVEPPPQKKYKKNCQLFYFADFTQKLPALVKICLFLLIFRCLLIRVILRHSFPAYSIFLYECMLNTCSYNNVIEYGNFNI